MDLDGLYTGNLSPLKAARLAEHLPPGSAIFRGEDIDSRLLTDAEVSLRHLVNMKAETPIPFPSQEIEKAAKAARAKAKAEARFRTAN